MATIDDFFNKLKRKHPTLKDDLRGILKSTQSDSPQRSITLSQIRAAYSQRLGQEFPVKGGTRTQMTFMLTIPYVCCFSTQIGTLRFFSIETNQE
ncbi:uncharacterized protein [Drosophila bipectinata]|uniref:uncharacterized protein n=1 Tax=Drosophila bipectinata TaxID=42026 RepID=UPI0007E69717|nr:uncharacterized protein LOC108125575 [Drosophila bipectinata]